MVLTADSPFAPILLARPLVDATTDRSFDAALLACAVSGQGKRAASLLGEMASLEGMAQPVGQGGAEGEGGGERGAFPSVAVSRRTDRLLGAVFFRCRCRFFFFFVPPSIRMLVGCCKACA